MTTKPSRYQPPVGGSGTPATVGRSLLSSSMRRAVVSGLVCTMGLTGAVVANARVAHPASASTNVNLKHFAITPAKLKIRAGTKVTWHWLDGSEGTHTVTSKAEKHDLRFRDSRLKTTGTYTVRFTKPGVYYYECSVHPLTMQGVIIVK